MPIPSQGNNYICRLLASVQSRIRKLGIVANCIRRAIGLGWLPSWKGSISHVSGVSPVGRRPETAILPESRAALVPPHAQITCGAWPGRMARAG